MDELRGLPDGTHRLAFSNGCTYTGLIRNGMQDGYGVHTCKDGVSTRTHTRRHVACAWFSTSLWPAPHLLTCCVCSCVQSVYDGYRFQNYRHGQGRKSGPNGGYVGGWAMDKRQGEGCTFDANGFVIDAGTWDNDRLVSRRQVQGSQLAPVTVIALACSTGHDLETEFTLGGILCCVLLFPLGILCCCVMRQHRCKRCGTVFEN